MNFLLDKDPVAENHKREMEELSQYIESKQLSSELSSRLINYFKFQYQKAVENRASSSVPLPRYSMNLWLHSAQYSAGALGPNSPR